MTELSLNKEVEEALKQSGVAFHLASVDCNLYEVKIDGDKIEAESDRITEALRDLMEKGVEVNEKRINDCNLCTTYIFSREGEKVSLSVLLK